MESLVAIIVCGFVFICGFVLGYAITSVRQLHGVNTTYDPWDKFHEKLQEDYPDRDVEK